MGLDAYVTCRCWQDGLTPPAPMEVYWDEHDQCVYPVEPDLPIDDLIEMDIEFDRWCAAACPHDDMRADSERISNWAGVGRFSQFLARNRSLAPVLVTEWFRRQGNGGYVPPDLSAAIRIEIGQLETTAVPRESDPDDRRFVLSILGKLCRLFTASVETGNPVCWA